MANRDKVSRSSARRSGGEDGIQQLTSLDGTVVLTPPSGTGNTVDLSAPAAGTIGTIASGNPGIVVTNPNGPITTLTQNTAAEWPTGVTRIYAVDTARPNDLGAGFADPATSSAADYRTASVAAGAVAKKTIAGLAAIFPKVGNGRQVEIQIAGGAYNGDDLSALLNGCTGYAGGIVVRGTGTVATAGTTKFDGTAADTSTVGGVTGTGLFAAGYNTIASANTQSMTLLQVGGGAVAFAFPNGLPLGIRARFDVATTTAADRNQARQVARVPSADHIALQTGVTTQPAGTDTLYLEQPGVRLSGNLNLNAPGTDGIVFVGLGYAGSLNVDPAAGRHRFVFCTFDDAGTETLQSASGVVVAQSYTHSVYGATTPGGGLLCQGNVTLTGPRLGLEGLVSQLATTVIATDSTWVWGAGCASRNLIVNSSWSSDSDDAAEQPNIGVNDSTATDGQPTTFGVGANGALQLNASAARIGRVRFNTFAGKAAIYLTGKCNVGFVGAGNADSDGSGNVGLSLADSTDSEIRIGSTAPTGVTGTQGDIAWAGPVFNAWAPLGTQDGHDASGNHIYYAFSNGQYQHRPPPSVFRSVFSIGGGAVVRYGLLRISPGTNFVIAASNTNINDAQGLAGTSETNAPADVTNLYVRPPGGATMVAFDAAAAKGQTAYISATAGLATVTPPASGPVIPIGVVVSGAGTECVVQWFPAGTNTGAADWPLPVSNATPNIRWYALDFTNGIDTHVGFSDTSAADAGTKAVKTAARLNQILPIDGKGRNVVVIVAAADYADSSSFLMGRSGYTNFLVRATITDATAGSVAFADDANDRNMNGAITATGMNAAGYNPTGVPTTRTIQCLKVGGAAPGFPAEVPISFPGGARIRFDINTTTVALRGVRRTIVKVAGTDTLDVDKLLPAAPVAADVFYLEMPGCKFTVLRACLYNGPDNGGQSQISGLQSNGPAAGARDILVQGSINMAMCAFAGVQGSVMRGNTVSLNSVYVNVDATNQDTGGACRSAGGFTLSGSSQFIVPTGTGPYAVSLTFSRGGTVELPSTSVVTGGCSYTRVVGTAQNSAETDPDCIGTTATLVAAGLGPVRIIGPGTVAGLNLAAFATIAALDITGMGAKPAIAIRAAGVSVVITGPLTGTTGNTDVGLDLTNAQRCTIYLDAVPTVTGTAGDVRLAGGQIITWAQAATGITDSRGNRIFGTTNLPLLGHKFVGALFGGGGAALSYAADTGPSLLLANEAVAVRYPTSIGLRLRLRVLVLALSTNTINNTVTLFKNGVATTMTITVPAATAAGTVFTDSAHPILFVDGDDFALQAANAGADAGAVLKYAAILEQAT